MDSEHDHDTENLETTSLYDGDDDDDTADDVWCIDTSPEIERPAAAIGPFVPDDEPSESVSGRFRQELATIFCSDQNNFIPNVYNGSLDDAFRQSDNSKLLALYLHHSRGITSNVYCSQLLCSESGSQLLNEKFILWAWDCTTDSMRARFIGVCRPHLSKNDLDSLPHAPNSLPQLIIVAHRPSGNYVLSGIEYCSLQDFERKLNDAYQYFQSIIAGDFITQEAEILGAMWRKDNSGNSEEMVDQPADSTSSEKAMVLHAMKKLICKCKELGLKCRFRNEWPIGGTFFQIVADQIKVHEPQSDITPGELRNDVVDFLLANPVVQASEGEVNFQQFIVDKTWDEYCSEMRNPLAYVDTPIMYATAIMLSRYFTILTSTRGHDQDVIEMHISVPAAEAPQIFLGHIQGLQFYSLVEAGREICFKRKFEDAFC